MKTLAAAILAIGLVFCSQFAVAKSSMVSGLVIKVDQSAKKITIKHGPIPQLDMDEGMTMVYAVADPKMLATVKAGEKVKFEVEQVNGQYTVTKIEIAK